MHGSVNARQANDPVDASTSTQSMELEDQLYRMNQPSGTEVPATTSTDAIFHHVEDILNAEAYPPWSTGVSRINSRPDSPAHYGIHSNPMVVDSLRDAEAFNPARIPLDMAEIEPAPHASGQIPIEQVVESVDTSLGDRHKDGLTLEESTDWNYEHQNVNETTVSRESESEPMLHESLIPEDNVKEGLGDSEMEETFVIHPAASDGRPSRPDDLFEDTTGNDDPFGDIGLDEHLLEDSIPDTSVEMTPRVSQGPRFSSTSDGSQDLAFTDSLDKQITYVQVPEPGTRSMNAEVDMEIPDDLDEADFDIDHELDAEFAEFEANFQQTANIESLSMSEAALTKDKKQTLSAHVVEPNELGNSQLTSIPMNPYKPVNTYAATQTSNSIAPQQRQAGLFTPAQLLNPNIMQSSNMYNPQFQTNSPAPSEANLQMQQTRKASASSFVSGKVAYNDPYALPETMVVKKRVRPQTQQSLRAAASVPNLKAQAQSRPVIGQRYASARGTPPGVSSQYQSPPPARPPSVQNATQGSVGPAPGNLFPTNSANIQSHHGNASQPFQQSQAYAPQQSIYRPTPSPGNFPMSDYHPHPRQVPSHENANAPQSRTNTSQQNNLVERPSYTPTQSAPPPPREMVHKKQDFMYSEAVTPVSRGASPYAPTIIAQESDNLQTTYRNNNYQENLRPNNSQNDSNIALRGGQTNFETHYSRTIPQPLPVGEMNNNAPQGPTFLAPHPNSASYGLSAGHQRQSSSVSTQSHDSEDSRRNEYDNFLNDQRGAENQMFDDSYAVAHEEIQEAQSIQRAGSAMNLRRNADLNELSGNEAKYPPTSYGTRRSLDESLGTATLQMTRPTSRGSSGQYARTEPPSSPRRNSGISHDGNGLPKSMNAPVRRPAFISRATSSSQAYQTFPRTQSPRLPRQNSILPSNRASSDPTSGHPIACFGFGGRFLTTIPKTVPRFSPEGTMVTQNAGPGFVNIRQLKDIVTGDVLGDFPGPLLYSRSTVKQKKIDVQLWLTKQVSANDSTVKDDKALLYRLLMLLLEFNGVLENPAAKGKLTNLLCPELGNDANTDELANFTVAANMNLAHQSDSGSIISTSVLTDSAVEKLAYFMLKGDKDSALRFACDRKLWAHAMVIASRMAPPTWSNVIEEFANVELQTSSDAAEQLKFLYGSFASTSGTATATTHGSTSHQVEKWRKSLTMILNNRDSSSDEHVISKLGRSLSASGRTHAAHFCYLLCTTPAIGATDDQHAAFSMVGSQDLANGGWTVEKNEAIIMSEIYEFCLSLSQPKFLGFPHLLALKLQRAQLLADAGLSPIAKKYCDGITSALKVLPKSTTQIHRVLVEQLRDLTHRIDQNPSEESPSWLGSKIARPKMDNIWGSLEGKFNKFVAGDAEQQSETGEQNTKGPFGKLAQTPVLSRVQSVVDMRSRGSVQSTGSIGGYDAETLRPVQSFAQVDQGSYPYAGSQNVQTLPTQQSLAPQSFQDSSGMQPDSQAPHGIGPSVYQPINPAVYQPINPQGDSAVQQVYDQIPRQPINSPFAPHQESLSQPTPYNYAPRAYPQSASGSQTGSPQTSFDVVGQAGLLANQGNNPISTYMPVPEKQALDERPSSHLPPSSTIEPVSRDTVASKEANSKTEENQTSESDEKKAGWLGGWFGGGKKKEPVPKDGDIKVHKAKLGEGMSLVYDPVTKKWTNPKGSMPEESKTSAPPPPMAKRPQMQTPVLQQGHSNISPASQAQPPQPSGGPVSSNVSRANNPPAPAVGSAAPHAGVAPRKLASADDDLAAMLSSGPPSRRGASASGSSTPVGTGRAKKGKPAKRYVDVFQENT